MKSKKEKLLENGTPVIYVFDRKLENPEATMHRFKKEGLDPELKKDGIYVKGFIAKDTYELGISILSLDNPIVCLHSIRPGIHDIDGFRKLIRETGMFSWSDSLKLKNDKYAISCGQPKCQYR